MLSNLQAADYDEALPEQADVVVIGGGIAGVATALALTDKGISVAVCEKGRIAAEQSSRNWGWCRVMGRDAYEIPLGLESLKLWRGMEKRVEADIGFRQPGTVWAFDRDRDLAEASRWLQHAQDFQIDTRLLDSAGVAACWPAVRGASPAPCTRPATAWPSRKRPCPPWPVPRAAAAPPCTAIARCAASS